MTRTITVAMLQDWDACYEQVETFAALFGPRADVTAENLTRAVAAGLDLAWLAGLVLTPAALAECRRMSSSAFAEYQRVKEAAWAECERVMATARTKYQRVTDAAWAEYARARNAASAALLLNDANWEEVAA